MATTLGDIETLERDLLGQVQDSLVNTGLTLVDIFLLAATSRSIAQSRGFLQLIESRNAPSATVLLRAQIDTAMRINGLSLMEDVDSSLRKLIDGRAQFDRLTTGSGKQRLTDAFLREKLAEVHPWVSDLYVITSEFVHLSNRHLWSSFSRAEGTPRFIVGTDDPKTEYGIVCHDFFRVSRLTGELILSTFRVHRARPNAAIFAGGSSSGKSGEYTFQKDA